LQSLVVLLALITLAFRLMIWLLTSLTLARTECACMERAQLQKLEQALELYKLDNGVYPTTEQGLSALVAEPTLEPHPARYVPGGYVRQADLEDCYGADFHYRQPGTHDGRHFDLCSAGRDGELTLGEAGSDDICNWTRRAGSRSRWETGRARPGGLPPGPISPRSRRSAMRCGIRPSRRS